MYPKEFGFSKTSKLGRLCSVFMEANSFGIDICIPYELSIVWSGKSEFLGRVIK